MTEPASHPGLSPQANADLDQLAEEIAADSSATPADNLDNHMHAASWMSASSSADPSFQSFKD